MINCSKLFYRIMGVNSGYVKKIVDSDKPISFLEWKKMFESSSSVHLAGSTRKHVWQLSDDPGYSVYALLGPRYCPLSYYSVKYF